MSENLDDYPWSTLLPQEILIEQLLKNDYNSLLILCMSDDERFNKVCTDSFWNRKLDYELETREMTPQTFFDLSSRNGWARFMVMLLNKYTININYEKILPIAASRGHTLAVKIIVNYVPDWILKAKDEQVTLQKELDDVKRKLSKNLEEYNLILRNIHPTVNITENSEIDQVKNEYRTIRTRLENERYDIQHKLHEVKSSILSWSGSDVPGRRIGKRKSAIIFAYEKALENNRFDIIEFLKKYKNYESLKKFFNMNNVKNLQTYIKYGSLEKLHSPVGNIFIHIYNHNLDEMKEFTTDEKDELEKTINLPKILLFASDFYEPGIIEILEGMDLLSYEIPLPTSESSISYQPKMLHIIQILVRDGKFTYVKDLIRSNFVKGILDPIQLLRSSVMINNAEFAKILLSEYNFPPDLLDSVKKSLPNLKI